MLFLDVMIHSDKGLLYTLNDTIVPNLVPSLCPALFLSLFSETVSKYKHHKTSYWQSNTDYIGGHFCPSYSSESQEISLPGLVLEQLSGKLRLPPYFPPNHPTPNGNEGKFNCYICSRPLPVFRGRSGRGERIKSTARRRHQKLCHAGNGMMWRV